MPSRRSSRYHHLVFDVALRIVREPGEAEAERMAANWIGSRPVRSIDCVQSNALKKKAR